MPILFQEKIAPDVDVAEVYDPDLNPVKGPGGTGVSLFFSDPTASGLVDPPAVLVQGDAEVSDEVRTWAAELDEFAPTMFKRQPAGELYSSNAMSRYLFDWYYMRLFIYVTPRRIIWWEHGDFSRVPHEMEVSHGHVE